MGKQWCHDRLIYIQSVCFCRNLSASVKLENNNNVIGESHTRPQETRCWTGVQVSICKVWYRTKSTAQRNLVIATLLYNNTVWPSAACAGCCVGWRGPAGNMRAGVQNGLGMHAWTFRVNVKFYSRARAYIFSVVALTWNTRHDKRLMAIVRRSLTVQYYTIWTPPILEYSTLREISGFHKIIDKEVSWLGRAVYLRYRMSAVHIIQAYPSSYLEFFVLLNNARTCPDGDFEGEHNMPQWQANRQTWARQARSLLVWGRSHVSLPMRGSVVIPTARRGPARGMCI